MFGRSSGRYVLGEPHINVFLGLRVQEQDAVLASLLDHAYVNVVPLLALLLGLGVLVHHAGEKGSVVVGVLGNEVEAHACWDPNRAPEETA